jgi:hypothetical protein
MKKLIAVSLMLLILCMGAAVFADSVMHAPTGIGKVTFRDGTSMIPDGNGNVLVPSKHIADALMAGYVFSSVLLPVAQNIALTTSTTGTLTGAQMAGAQYNTVVQSGQSAATAWWTPTAAQLSAAQFGGNSFTFQIINANTSTGVITLNSSDPKITISGTATTAISAYHEYICSFATPSWTCASSGTGGSVAP